MKVRQDVAAPEGFCSLAEGADQIFADLILSHLGKLHVIIPCDDYIETFTTQADRDKFQSLLAQASSVTHMKFSEASEEAFWAAGRAVVEESDQLYAVWNGQAAGGLGGTADVVGYAKSLAIPVTIVWPTGSTRV
ncbi:hypothetical protein [Nocardioides panacisoli]|uniref:Uncharacterized protein n=1 Tax=Nocardioides panacisoli TaxID=627624 RepID=A0ABP7HS93_9ACTN